MEKILIRYRSLYGLGPLLGFLVALFLSAFVVSFHCGHWIGWILMSPENEFFTVSLRKRHGGGLLEKLFLLSVLYIPALIIWKTSSGRFHRIKRVNSVSSDLCQEGDWEDIYKELGTDIQIDNQLKSEIETCQPKPRNMTTTPKPARNSLYACKFGKGMKANILIAPCEVSLKSVLLNVVSTYEHLGHNSLISYIHKQFNEIFKTIYFFYRVGVYLVLGHWHLFVSFLQVLRISLFPCTPSKPPGLEEAAYMDVWKKYNKKFAMFEKLPNKVMSIHWGWFHNNVEMPRWLRVPLLSIYVWMFKCKVNEANIEDLRHYKNLSEFFRRDLKAGLRPVSYAHELTSPADGTVLYCGKVKDSKLEQVKGVYYSMKGFLGEYSGKFAEGLPKLKTSHKCALESTQHREKNINKENQSPNSQIEGAIEARVLPKTDVEYAQSLVSRPGNCLHQCIIYLSPGDYHKFHSAADWTALARRYIPGELFSVKPSVARWLQGLFNFNERVVYAGKWEHGFFSFTAVGATNVGSINVFSDKEVAAYLQTDKNPSQDNFDKSFDAKKTNSSFKRGQIFGEFNLGSTIVLLFEAPRNFKFSVKPGQKVEVGQGLGFTKKHRKACRKN